MSKFKLFRRLIAAFKEAFDFAAEPPLCFYLKGRPFLEEPYQISTPDLRNVCLLNGVTFHIYGDLGCQASIEDWPGLIAVVCAATSWGGQQANLHGITGWRRYRDDDRTLVEVYRELPVSLSIGGDRPGTRLVFDKKCDDLARQKKQPWILERGATVYEKRICTSLPSSLRIGWNGVLKPRHFLGVRLVVRTMSWISSSDTLSMSV